MNIWLPLLVFLITLAALALNLPFGYLRGKTRRLSIMWFFYIHIPIPFIFLLRTASGLGLKYVPIIAVGAVIGQWLGGRINTRLNNTRPA
jgi:hypothetical protein